MTRRVSTSAAWLLSLSLGVPATAAAQCGVDRVQSGIEAYRNLDLVLATELLRSAAGFAEQSSPGCDSETARALTYLGASYWLNDRPDSAGLAFERAVIQAPRHRPDPLEFPPEITDLFEDIRRITPSVAVTVPQETELARDDETLDLALTASTTHSVAVELWAADVGSVRTLYQGLIPEGARATLVTWDGRGADGGVVESGRYEVHVVSYRATTAGASAPVRKVVLGLTVDATPIIVAPSPRLEAPEAVLATASRDGDRHGTWSAVGSAAAGLLGGLIVAIPFLVGGDSGILARYGVAGAVSAAGLVGLVLRLRGGRSSDPPVRPEVDPVPPHPPAIEGQSAAPTRPILTIRAGQLRRMEMDGGGP